MRVAVVDVGTNATRLLVADVEAGRVTEVERRTTITRLGERVDGAGRLADPAMGRVLETIAAYRHLIDGHGAQRAVAVLTSAVRDAANGGGFAARLRDDHGLEAHILDGDDEARLTFLGATSERAADDDRPLVVVDVGGGSTEFVVGEGHVARLHVSTQAGAVRQTERHLRHDPPTSAELGALRDEARELFAERLPAAMRATDATAIAVAGTPISLAAIDRHGDTRVHGTRLTLEACEAILARLAALPERERREVRGLHPDRAATIVAGAALLIEALAALGVDAAEVSEHDILRGAALRAVGAKRFASGPMVRRT
jgi:exopolyphosphatase / guanosine-5'-triphosphate,3'-diphosphate pyrophosphatase